MQNMLTERLVAVAISLAAWAGLGLQLDAILDNNWTLSQAIWRMSRYFTTTTNLAVALLFGGIALGIASWRASGKVAGVGMAIMLVGIVFQLLLRGLIPREGVGWTADFIMHTIMPVAVPLYWFAFTPKGMLRWPHPLIWAIYPWVYFGYALLRVADGDHYPYPFLNVPELGWHRVALNVMVIAVSFMMVGFGVVLLDTGLGKRRKPV